MNAYNAGELLQLLRDQRALIARERRDLEKDERDLQNLREKAVEIVSKDPNWQQFVRKYLKSESQAA